MKISIITICYNAEKSIENTVLSVLNQTYKNIEYIIIDGESTDKTLEILDKYTENKKIKIYCEPDFGVYNAMNRGITRISGDYVIFMNAGDQFYNELVLNEIRKFVDKKDKCILYGKVYRVHSKKGDKIKDFSQIARSPLQGFLNKEMPCHQGIIAPADSLKNFYFKEEFKYCADFDWLIRCYKAGYQMINTDCMICKYDNTGLTSDKKNRKYMKQESEIILKRNFPVLFRLQLIIDKIRNAF